MSIIRPSTDLENNYKELSDLCKATNNPIYITVNGKKDTVLVSNDFLNELYMTIEAMQQINKGLSDLETSKVYAIEEVMKKYI